MKTKIQILFEDKDILVVNKPAPLLSIPDRYNSDKFNLHAYLEAKFGESFIVHRLDKETSGVIVFARNGAAHKSLSEQFEKRKVRKKYLALVEGHPNSEEGNIDKPIAPSQGGVHKMTIAKKGKPSLSHYKTLEKFKKYSLLEVEIFTGRTHQIRVHLEAIGNPLAVDKLYGRNEAFYLSQIKLKKYKLGKNQEERPLMTRNSLHSSQLSFNHPSSREQLLFEADLPKDFQAVINQLRKWGKP